MEDAAAIAVGVLGVVAAVGTGVEEVLEEVLDLLSVVWDLPPAYLVVRSRR